MLGRGAPGRPHVRQGIDQFAQVALHEIGHALGGTTHHEGEGVMVRFVEQGVPCVSSDDLAWIGVDGEGTCR